MVLVLQEYCIRRCLYEKILIDVRFPSYPRAHNHFDSRTILSWSSRLHTRIVTSKLSKLFKLKTLWSLFHQNEREYHRKKSCEVVNTTTLMSNMTASTTNKSKRQIRHLDYFRNSSLICNIAANVAVFVAKQRRREKRTTAGRKAVRIARCNASTNLVPECASFRSCSKSWDIFDIRYIISDTSTQRTYKTQKDEFVLLIKGAVHHWPCCSVSLPCSSSFSLCCLLGRLMSGAEVPGGWRSRNSYHAFVCNTGFVFLDLVESECGFDYLETKCTSRIK